jgi:hypothetical protein
MADPQVVYHYTSADTLLKIVANKGAESIWATNLRYLNDVKESDHCLEMLRYRLPQFVQLNHSPHNVALEAALLHVNQTEWNAPFVASFSAYRDSLPQWRSYCPNGIGVSIGFSVSALNQCTLTRKPLLGKIVPPSAHLDSVKYLRDDDWEKVDRILSQSLEVLDEWKKDQAAAADDERANHPDDKVLESIIANRACLVKHASFESEMEYRLLAPPRWFSGKSIRYRCSRTTVIPYVDLLMPEWGKTKHGPSRSSPTFDDYFIEEVVVGPTPNPDLTVSALSGMFMGLSVVVPVRKTSVPFRDI